MWSAYRQLEKARLVGYLAHLRRKFFEGTPKRADKSSLELKELRHCEWSQLPSKEGLPKRQVDLAPLMIEFFDCCQNQAVLPGSKPRWALDYSFKYDATLKTFWEDENLVR